MGGRGLRDEVSVAGFLGQVDGLIGLRFLGIFVASAVLFCFVLYCFCFVDFSFSGLVDSLDMPACDLYVSSRLPYLSRDRLMCSESAVDSIGLFPGADSGAFRVYPRFSFLRGRPAAASSCNRCLPSRPWAASC